MYVFIIFRRMTGCWRFRLVGRILSRHLLKALFLTNLAVLPNILIAATPVPIAQMYHQAWTTRDGAPNNIEDFVQGPDGFLWITTDGGLYRFDGVSFERYVSSDGSALRSDDLNRIVATPDGSVWVTYMFAGLSRIKDGKITTFTEKDGLRPQQITDIMQRPDGSIWIGGTFGIQALKGLRWTDTNIGWTGSANTIRSLSMDHEGNLWIARAHDMEVLPKDANSLSPIDISVMPDMFCKSGSNAGVWCLNPGATIPVVHLQWVNGHVKQTAVANVNQPRSILDSGDGTLWIGTEHGIQRYSVAPASLNGRPLDKFTHRDGLTDEVAFDLARDREGDIWVATVNGLDKFRPIPFTAVNLSGAVAVQLPHGNPGARDIIATDHLIDVSADNPVSISAKFAGNWARSLFRSKDGTLWIGTTGHLSCFANGKLSVHSLPSDLNGPPGPVLAITEDVNHGIWISLGSGQGVFRFDGEHWIRRGAYPSFPDEIANFAERDHTGAVWFGFRNDRLVRVSSRQLHEYGISNGLDLGDLKAFAEQDANVWIAGDKGVAVLKDDTAYPLLLAGQTPLRGVTGLAFAPDGALWINQISGVIRIAKSDLALDVLTSGRAINYRLFDYRDGLQGIPHSLLGLGSAWMAPGGKLYVANRTFLQWVDPLHLPHNDILPQAWIMDMRADARDYRSPVGTLTLKPRSESVQINYTATSLLIPSRVRFRYQLEGYDRQWIDAGTRRQAFYAKLPPGSYTFRVMASNDSGVWSKSVASVSFTEPPTFVQTVWFHVLWLTAIASILILAYVLRVRQITTQLRKGMYERLAERERIARDLHDTLFQGIQGLLLRIHTLNSGLPEADSTRQRLEATLQQSDQVMREARELVLDLRVTASTPNDLPALLTDYGKTMQEDHVCAFEVVVNGAVRALHQVVYEEVSRIGKEALGNAFRHSEARSIEVELSYEPSELRMRIRDNGVGIDPNILEQGRRDGHWGLPGMRERAQKIGAHLEIWSRAGAGTEIELRVAARIAFAPGPESTTKAGRLHKWWLRMKGKAGEGSDGGILP